MAVMAKNLPKTMDVEPAEKPLRIAIVYGRIPFPMVRGDQKTIAHLIAYLGARGHQVDLYTLDIHGEMQPAQREFLDAMCRQVSIYRHGKPQIARGLLKARLKGWPLQVGFFHNDELTRDFQAKLDAGEYDIAYVYYMRSAPVVGERFAANQTTTLGGTTTAAFLAMQLSQSLNCERILEGCRGLHRKLLYTFETKWVKRFESTIWKRYTRTVLIGPKDVEAVKQACGDVGQPPPDNWVYGAHGTDVFAFRAATPDEVVPRRIVFAGNMAYRPNVDGICWFVANCYDRIKAAQPDVQLYVVGFKPDDAVTALGAADESITVTGAVDDVGEYMRSAEVCINPVQAAAGMQNKLIEYLACGRPVVCSLVANEGIRAPDDCVIAAADPDAFADGVINCLQHPAEANERAARGRRYVEQKWTWESHWATLEQNFRDALAGAPPNQSDTTQNATSQDATEPTPTPATAQQERSE